ncbi:MAG: FkbM family methyltransferase [Bacteroidales bacterium]|nr:FkbM family methyltransferase [Bacteroidales bacterium]
MKKLKTYYKYLKEYLKHGDFESIFDSLLYLLFGKGSLRNRIVYSGIGKIHIRKGTNDFQYANYFYEWTVKKFIFNNMREYGYFFDIGAGIGEYTLLLSQNGKTVFTFEPQESSFQSILINLNINQFNNTTVFHCGLGKKNQVFPFAINPVNTGASHILTPDQKLPKGYKHSQIKVKRLDDIINDLSVDFNESFLIKLDVEGMEADVLEGAKTFIKKCKHTMIIMEDKHSGESKLVSILDTIDNFTFGRVDDLNIYAQK